MSSISGLAPCPECGHLNLGEVCSECGFSFKRELIFWGGGRPFTPAPVVPPNITITSLTTGSAFNDVSNLSSFSTPAVTLATGDSILVCIAATTSLDLMAGVTWNAQTLFAGIDPDLFRIGTDTSLFVSAYHNVTGGTGTVDIVVTQPSHPAGLAVTVSKIAGLNATTHRRSDNVASSEGSGSTPSVTMSGPTNHAGEILIGAVSNNNGPVGGAWGNGFSPLSSADNSALGGSDGLSVGYRIVSSLGTFTANKTGCTTVGWSAGIASYYP